MDIVKRLRLEIGGYTDYYLEKAESDMKEAADEIERLRQQNAELVEAIKITLDTCSVIIILPEHSDDGKGHEYCFVCGADHDEPHDDDCIIPKLQATIDKATGGE